MFVCKDCLERDYENDPSLFASFGKCEICGESKLCSDIKSSSLILRNPPPLKGLYGDEDVEWIKNRINSEFNKHKKLDWALLAAKKIVGNLNYQNPDAIKQKTTKEIIKEALRLIAEKKKQVDVDPQDLLIACLAEFAEQQIDKLQQGDSFSRMEIEQLQHKVYQITGKGEVRALFNQLLGVAQG